MLRRYCALLIIFVLIIGGIKTHVPQDLLQLVEARQLVSLYGDEVLICTSDGFKYIKAHELAAEMQKNHKKASSCKLCQAYCGNKAFYGNVYNGFLQYAFSSANHKFLLQQDLSVSLIISQFASRAPPQFS